MIILNLTQHPATPEQIEQGLIDPPADMHHDVQLWLTFDTPPPAESSPLDPYLQPESATIGDRAAILAHMASDLLEDILCIRGLDPNTEVFAMIGGAPFLMSALEAALTEERISPVYAFSKRESIERVQPDGTTRKVSVFNHAGWVFPPVQRS